MSWRFDMLAWIDVRGSPGSGARRRGFTLIELLIVIAIIGLLMTVLLPSLRRARVQAKAVLCAANLRPIGQAWEMYLNDNNDTFPASYGHRWWTYGGKESGIWYTGGDSNHRPINPHMAMLQRGQPQAEVFRCPSDRPIRNGRGAFAVTDGHSTYDYFGNSYMLNGMFLYGWDRSGEEPRRIMGRGYKRRDVSIAWSRVVLAGDCQWYYTMADVEWDAQFHGYDRVNLLFLDGHVTYMQLVRGQDVTRDFSFYPWYEPYGIDQDEPAE